MLIPNPHNEKLVYFNEVLREMFDSVYDFLHPSEFKNYVIYQRQMRWKVYQDVRDASQLCKELIKDSNSKGGYAINIRKFQEYPSKPCVSDVKCAENTKAYLWNFVEGVENKILQLKEKSSKLYNKDHQIPAHKSNELSFYTWKLQELENIEKKTEKPLNNIIHVQNQLRKRYHPAACVNAEERRRKRRVKENKRKSNKRKEQTLLKNAQKLANIVTGTESGDRILGSNPLKIGMDELSALNKKMLTPRKHLQPLKFLLEKNYFHEDAMESIVSIISVLKERQRLTKKTSENKRKKRNNNEAPPRGQQTLFDVFQVKKCDTANNSDEHVICNISECCCFRY